MSTSLSEILFTHGLDESILKRTLSKEDRQEFCERIKEWKTVGAALGFTQEELDIIDDQYENDEGKKNILFWKWIVKHRREATYLKLTQVLFDGGLTDLLEDLCAILMKAAPTNSISVKLGRYIYKY